MKDMNEDSRFQAAVDYLSGYSGVIGAVVADGEGLEVACSPRAMKDGELFAASGIEIFNIIDKSVFRIMEPGCGYISIKTGSRWLTIAAALNLFLVVLADRKADDLLNVRIQRALDMITTNLKEKYPAEVYSTEPAAVTDENKMEATHV